MIKCIDCKFCDLVVEAGTLFSFINPYGSEVEREHPSTIYICRANPPIAGSWPEVSEDDWCGKFQVKEGVA
jgi:hypothetical protein